MKNNLRILTVLLFCLMLGSCKKDNVNPLHPVMDLTLKDLNSYFEQAKKLTGGDAALYLISADQKNQVASLDYSNMVWKFRFIHETSLITFTVDGEKVDVSVETKSADEIAVGGYEYVYANDSRLNSIISPITMWNKCVTTYKKPILNLSLYVPFRSTATGYRYVYYTKDGNTNLGEDSFVFDAANGADITNR